MAEDISLKIIRTTIFSIVVPHKEPCSSHKIRMEYKDMEGEEIPFGDYGHRNLDEFLISHPMLNGMKQEGKWVFTAKMSERSANIQELVRGQKGKKRKGKKGANPFARSNFSRSSYHGKPTLGQGDVRRSNGSFPFNRNTSGYRSFTSGTSRGASIVPVPSDLSQSKSNGWGSQQTGGARPGSSLGFSSSSNGPPIPRPSQPYQPRKFIPTLAPTRSSLSLETSSSARPDGHQEGMRRFNIILSKCKGAATLRVFCRLYAQEFNVAFCADELRRHFNTANLAEVINKYGNDKILVSPTPDGSVMFTDSQVLEAHTRAARELEERKKNSVVIEPEKKHCSIPSLKLMYDEMTEMLMDSFPNGIHVGEITCRFEEKTGVKVDPVAVFAHSWSELIEAKFNSRIKIDSGKAVLTPVYIKANNLQARMTGERKKQELVTLSGLGIAFVEDSSQEDEDEDEDDSQSETASIVSGDVKNANNKASWRAPPSGYESMCSSVSSSIQCINVSPRETIESGPSEEVDELAARMRKVEVDEDEDCPRTVTINGQCAARRNLMDKLSGSEEKSVVEEKEKEKPPKQATRGFLSKLGFSFGNSSRSNVNASPSPSPSVSTTTTVKEEANEVIYPNVITKPSKELKMKADGDYKSFSISLNSKDVYALKVTCKSPYYRILGHTSYSYVGGAKLLQVIREEGPKGVTTISIDFVKKPVGEKRSAVQLMETSTPHFTIEYAFNAVSEQNSEC
ncbi:hypothetical protein PENTCL1PPCAC_11554 [Pristionchus entomophagus]|uniref:HTH OST-type domain-containing protein n=1 Tax=Pristionchus entomophagus TaxID=358040 RepID=A0AAV5T9S8_9BILA|nr:hypothetical protein PENTCL1PPCAC_11554 [Pristionchus entomophagus]